MAYFNYHGIAKRLIREGKLKSYRFAKKYNGISPALILYFDDIRHPIMPIREDKWEEYMGLIKENKQAE